MEQTCARTHRGSSEAVGAQLSVHVEVAETATPPLASPPPQPAPPQAVLSDDGRSVIGTAMCAPRAVLTHLAKSQLQAAHFAHLTLVTATPSSVDTSL